MAEMPVEERGHKGAAGVGMTGCGPELLPREIQWDSLTQKDSIACRTLITSLRLQRSWKKISCRL